jgi:geranylgeranyl pyrophosphate synthase
MYMRARIVGHNAMPDEDLAHEPAWWRQGDPVTVTNHGPGVGQFRHQHWAYFEENVLPCISRLIRTSFPEDIAETIRNRFANGSRFRASEFLYALLCDFGMAELGAGVWACAAVELLLLSRLVQDDVVDYHDYRWGVPTLRKLYGPDKASLAATELVALAVAAGEGMDHELRVINRSGPGLLSGPTLVVEYSRIMAQAMLRELLFDDISISEREYNEISQAKVSNGRLCSLICRAFSQDLDPQIARELENSARATDIAASIANDVAETDQRRGLDAVRFPAGEQRGDRTEFQLGRPTIFHVFMASDERLQVQSEQDIDESLDLSRLKPPELLSILTALGGIDYARKRRNEWMNDAFQILPSRFSHVAEWMNSTARLNI